MDLAPPPNFWQENRSDSAANLLSILSKTVEADLRET